MRQTEKRTVSQIRAWRARQVVDVLLLGHGALRERPSVGQACAEDRPLHEAQPGGAFDQVGQALVDRLLLGVDVRRTGIAEEAPAQPREDAFPPGMRQREREHLAHGMLVVHSRRVVVLAELGRQLGHDRIGLVLARQHGGLVEQIE